MERCQCMTFLDFHGMSWPEALADFQAAYDAEIASNAQTVRAINVVHGYGSKGVGGVLRLRLRDYLQRYRSYLAFKPGEQIDGNPGWTLIEAIKPLPLDDEVLEDFILAFCQQPRTMREIYDHSYGYRRVNMSRIVRSLQNDPFPLLRKIVKAGQELYQAV